MGFLKSEEEGEGENKKMTNKEYKPMNGIKKLLVGGLIASTSILNSCQSVQAPTPSTMSSPTVPRTSRNLVMPVARNDITAGTLDYVVEDNGTVILDDSRVYVNSKDNPEEKWVPFIENDKIKGHYVGTNDDLVTRLSGKDGVYSDNEHQVLRNGEDKSNNKWLYALGGILGGAVLYGLSKIHGRRREDGTEDPSEGSSTPSEEEITA
tara:strand:+ start:6969 stop:7592 length:624 start_codon:yes stop_codon:yes gene_type:complete